MSKGLVFLLTIFFLFNVDAAYSQAEYDKYASVYFGKSYNIGVRQDEKDNNKYTYYIDCESADKLIERVCLRLESKKLDGFIKFLREAKSTYVNWRETAIANDVVELDKTIDIKRYVASSAFLFGDEWKFDFTVPLQAYVKFSEDYKMLVIRSDKLVAHTNRFMDHDGFYLTFTHPDEIDEFIEKIDLEKLHKYFEEKNKKEELFK